MPFLFKKIRREIMNENNLGKTLVYAIGEILLVVVGILIAVQIDHWNEDRKDREREAFLVKEINRDMVANLSELEQSMETFKRVEKGGKEIMKMYPLTKEKVLSAEFGRSFQDFLYNPSYDPSQGIINSIVNSGNINLIRNDSLRVLLLTWEDVYQDYKEEELVAWNFGYELMDWLAENFPNPEHTSTDLNSFNFRTFQGKIAEKTSRYGWTINGEDNQRLRAHIEKIIELTESQ